MIRLLIADDHPLVRAGYRQLVADDPSIRLVGEAVDGNDLLEQLRTTPADVVVVDVSMPGPRFLDLVKRLRREYSAVRVLVVSVQGEGPTAIRALEAGAAGYVTKTHSADDLVAAVKKVHAGGRYVTPSLAEQLAEAVQGDRPRLSDREQHVLLMLAEGKTNKEIAAASGISPKTVTTYRARILKKLSLRTNADLVRYVLDGGRL